jgi:hypothetical protein
MIQKAFTNNVGCKDIDALPFDIERNFFTNCVEFRFTFSLRSHGVCQGCAKDDRIRRVSRPRTPNSRFPMVSQDRQYKYRESDISTPSPMVRMRLYGIPESLGHITYRPLLAKWPGSPGQYSDIETEPERIHGHRVPGHEIVACTLQMGQTLHMPGPNK